MTLKEKFRMANMVDNGSTILVKYQVIADDYAIGFAQWLMKTRFKSIESIPVERLLEIYKKEQGL